MLYLAEALLKMYMTLSKRTLKLEDIEKCKNMMASNWFPVINAVDDDDITPYATFTLKPICGTDTVRSLMSVPTMRAPDSHSSNSIEGNVRPSYRPRGMQ